MFLKHIDLTTALRPSYLSDEVLLFVQDSVGLYEGKYKLPNQQNGQVYLTSHRICYVDKEEPRVHSVALDLKDVDQYELYAGFMKSSPKITIVPKPLKRAMAHAQTITSNLTSTRSGTLSPSAPRDLQLRPPPESTATWVCTICSYSNPVPSNFDATTANAHTPLPPCLACGIKPTLAHVLKAAISNASKRTPTTSSAPVPQSLFPPKPSQLDSSSDSDSPTTKVEPVSQGNRGSTGPAEPFQCPRCTFSNHPSLLACEICGAPLLSQSASSPLPSNRSKDVSRTESPGPIADQWTTGPAGIGVSESVKISFRDGGVKVFYERLKGSMTQKKWLLQDAPPAPRGGRGNAADDNTASDSARNKTKTAGIAGLEQRGLNMHKNNELLIGNAFEDLEALMASAKEVVALAERYARQSGGSDGSFSAEENAILAESASQLGLITTKDIVGGGSSEKLYLSELARNLAEFLTDDARGVLKKSGGIISLVDLWAMFNRARGGVELVSPMDFEKAARQWEDLKLPVRLRTFRSGVMVVQGQDRTDETTIRALLTWLQDLHEFPPEKEVTWDWREFGMGITAHETAERFGWSLGVAEEELLMAEEQGAVCREEGLEGLKFWKNYIDTGDIKPPKTEAEQTQEDMLKALEESGLL